MAGGSCKSSSVEGETGRTGRNDRRLNESRGLEDDGNWRSSLGASLVLVGLDPQLNILTVFDVRISGVLGIGNVDIFTAPGRERSGWAGRSIGGSWGAPWVDLSVSLGSD